MRYLLGRLSARSPLLFLFLVGPAVAQAQTPCEAAFPAAETQYLQGQFDEAVALLRRCIDEAPVAGETAVRVYRLLAMAHLQREDAEQAEAAIATLLSILPAYEADVVMDPPSYQALVARTRERARKVVRPQEPPAAVPPAATPPAAVVGESPQTARPAAESAQGAWGRAGLMLVGGAGVVAAAAAMLLGGGP